MVARTRKNSQSKPKADIKTKYTPEAPELLIMLVVECGMVNSRGEIAWGKVARAMGVSEMTLHNWRNPQKPETYHKEFHQAAKMARESVDAAQIKRGIIDLAKPHYEYDRTQELRKVGPTAPPKHWYKDDLIEWADTYLDLEIDPTMTKPQVIAAIARECFELTEEKLVTVKERRKKVVDVGAAKLALPNIGPLEERWIEKTEHQMTDKTLSDDDRAAIRAVLAENQR
jgi:hypothetical protein